MHPFWSKYLDYPKSVLNIAKIAADRFPNDIPQAVEEAEQAIRDLPEFDSLVSQLIHSAIQGLVYECRHRSNVELKKQAGLYGGPPKVNPTGSEAVARVYKSCYDYCIASTTLGELRGKDLSKIRDNELEVANGHLFNVALLEWLESRGVKGEKRVRDVVPEKVLRSNFERIRKEVQG